MIAMFPMDMSADGAFYAVLYVLTWVIHAALAAYVLAGTGYIAVTDVRVRSAAADGQRGESDATVVGVLRDWMPFALGVAITAGVAPLLFVQVLYKHAFYTANLLLFHRWMALLPVLIVGFYLLYLVKTGWYQRSVGRRWWVTVPAFACFLFTAYSWAENHLLSLASQDQWTRFYADRRNFFVDLRLVVRLIMWSGGAVGIMLLIVGWQLRGLIRRSGALVGQNAIRASRVALVSLVIGAIAAVAYSVMDAAWREQVLGDAMVYAIIALIGGVAQTIGWLRIGRRGVLAGLDLSIASIGAVLTLVAVAAVRESVRVAALQPSQQADHLRDVAANGGWITFLSFAAANAIVITACAIAVRRGLRRELIKRAAIAEQ